MQRPDARRRRIVVPILVVVIALLVLCVIGITIEPARANLARGIGHLCGVVAYNGSTLAEPAQAPAREECLARAWERCQPAALTFFKPFVDGNATHDFIVEPALWPFGACALADLWSTTIVGSGTVARGTWHCAGLTREPDGIVIHGCGTFGDIALPRP